MSNQKTNMKFIAWGALLFAGLTLTFQSCKEKKKGTSEEISKTKEVGKDGFVSIFDGKTLDNWKGDGIHWRAENGSLVGEVTPSTLIKKNTFLVWQGDQPKDFELKAEFRITKDGNSGINYRSELLDSIPNALRGYQADIDGQNRYTGQNYEERKRTTLAYRGEKAIITSQRNPDEPGSLGENVKNNAWQNREVVENLGDSDSLKSKIKAEDWNKVHLIVKGNKLQHYVNGILMSEVIDDDTVNRSFSGWLGVQVHVGPPMKVEYRNILLKNL